MTNTQWIDRAARQICIYFTDDETRPVAADKHISEIILSELTKDTTTVEGLNETINQLAKVLCRDASDYDAPLAEHWTREKIIAAITPPFQQLKERLREQKACTELCQNALNQLKQDRDRLISVESMLSTAFEKATDERDQLRAENERLKAERDDWKQTAENTHKSSIKVGESWAKAITECDCANEEITRLKQELESK